MLSYPEYAAAQAQLNALGLSYDKQIAEAIAGVTDKHQAIAITRSLIPPYLQEYEGLLNDHLTRIAFNTLEYYKQELNLSYDSSVLADIVVENQYSSPYYGRTLDERLAISKRRLERIVVQTAQINPQRLAGLFTETVPFGAQINIDKRLFQGTAVKIEQDVAKEVARQADIPLIKWTLSTAHKLTCACEDLATQSPKSTVKYLEEHNLKVSPKGLYLRDEVPLPPHPNCQCEYGMVTGYKQKAPGVVTRSLQRILNIVKSLRAR